MRNATEHPRRQAILAALERTPGTSFRTLAKRVGIPTGTCRHHLSMLERRGLAWSTRIGGRLAIFVGSKPQHAEWVALQQMPDALDQRLLGMVQRGPVCGQAVFFSICPKTPKSTVQHRLARLRRWGLLKVNHQGRFLIFSLPPPASHLEAPTEPLEVLG